MENVYASKDWQIVPFLLIQQRVKFLGTRKDGEIVFFQFSPSQLCQILVNEFLTKKAPPCQPKDLLDSFETFKTLVFEAKGAIQ